jgi:outer membrane protein assembly factor BamB
MPTCRGTICALLVVLSGRTASAQDFGAFARVHLPGESQQALHRLQAIDRLLDPSITPRAIGSWLGCVGLASQPLSLPLSFAPVVADRPAAVWEQAEEAYYRLLSESGQALVTLPGDATGLSAARTSLQVRRLCQLRLATLPAGVLATYRSRMETEANRLLAQGRRSFDVAPFRQLVEELVGTQAAAEALQVLGEVAFEHGDFDEARAWWRRIAPQPTLAQGADEVPLLSFRSPARVDRARIEAEQILALAFQGRLTEARQELGRYHHRHPTARGTLAGREGYYSEIVHAAIQAVVKAGIANNSDPWPTFGGSISRNHVLTVCPSGLLWEDGPTWRATLPQLETSPPTKDAAPEHARRVLLHPIIVGQQVLVGDTHSVTSYQLTTGKRLFHYKLPGAGLSTGRTRFTLSADGGRAYARLGRQRLTPRKDSDAQAGSHLVCLDLSEPDNAGRTRLLWQATAQTNECFEGAPLVHGGRAYVALSRLTGKRVVTAIQCYDALGRLRWSRDVCEVPEFEESATVRTCRNLLTWAGTQLVYCTHTGAVVAVDPWSGQTLWVVRYLSRGPLSSDAEVACRDLAPCMYDDGRVFVAPRDSDRLFCLEAFTGRVLWEREGLEIVQLNGITQGRLLFSTRQGVHAVNVATGMALWQQPSEGSLGGLGRGLLAGSWMLWPTQDTRLPMRAVTLAEGRQQKGDEDNPFAEPSFFDPTQLRGIPAGNLALGQGCLVVATADELVAFVPRGPLRLVPAEPERRQLLQAQLQH